MSKFSFRALGATASALVLAGAIAAAPAAAQAQGVMAGAQTGAAAGVQDPLAGANFGPPANLYEVTIPGTPGRFCHWLQKSNAEIELRRQIANAAFNTMQWNHLAYDLKQLRRQLEARIAQSTADADAAAKAGDMAALSRHVAQRDLDRAAIRRLDQVIRDAERQEQASEALEERLGEMLSAVLERPIDECGVPNTETLTLLQGSKFDLGGGQPRVLPVDIPGSIPQRVCHPEDKANLVQRTSQARSNAASNLDQWRIRAAKIDQALRAGRGEAATLERAYHEATLQMELWGMELEKARAADERANAIQVADCTESADARVGSTGGLLDSLGTARSSNPALLAGHGQAGQLADFGVRNARPFDGSEAERALHERLREAEAVRERTAHPVTGPTPAVTPNPPQWASVDPLPAQTDQEPVAPVTADPPAEPQVEVDQVQPQTEVAGEPAPPAEDQPEADPDCPTHPGMAGTPEHVLEFHS